MVDKKSSKGDSKKATLKKKPVKKISKEDLKKVGGGMRPVAEPCTGTCTGHWESFSPNCGTSCNATK